MLLRRWTDHVVDKALSYIINNHIDIDVKLRH